MDAKVCAKAATTWLDGQTLARRGIAGAACLLPSSERMSIPVVPLTTHPGSLLSIDDLSLDEMTQILATAAGLEHEPHRERSQRVEGRTVALRRLGGQAQEVISLDQALEGLARETTPPDIARSGSPAHEFA